MSLLLFNTLTRKREPFVALHSPDVGLYTCGPTVYNYAHIGNLRSYIFEDILKRVLELNKYNVHHIMNITDVGHLTSDADAGEDKMLKGARREKKTVWEIAQFYTQAFKKDLEKLNVLPPNIYCEATKHIEQQIALIETLEKKGFTYKAGGNVYFDTSKCKDYGALAKLDLAATTKARVEKDEQKKNPHDFVLWFTKSKFQNQEMKWDSPFGVGYPGWHLECSAMAIKYLGEQFDIHCGGIDHIPIHHTNELAQSQSATGKTPWVKYWLHNEFLVLGAGEKMAKSGENFITLSSLEKKGFSALDYRYFCLGTHYRKPLMFNYDALKGAQNAQRKLQAKVRGLKASAKNEEQNPSLQEEYQTRFTQEVNEDLNTPKALATMWEVAQDEKLSCADKYTLLLSFDAVFGLGLKDLEEQKKEDVPQQITDLAKQRLEARKNKQWEKSDQLREKIKELGYQVADIKDDNNKEGFEIKKI